MKPWPFNRSQELALVQAAQAGDYIARNKLYLGYEDRIKTAHVHSGMGYHPAKFYYDFNPKGVKYEDYCDELFEVFLKALESFDIQKASMGKHPFYTYLAKKIGYAALTKVDEKKKEEENTLTSTTAVELSNRYDGKVSNTNHEGPHGPSKAYLDTDRIYDGDAVEYRQRKIRAKVKDVLSKLKGTRAGNTCEVFLNEAENGKPVVLDVAKKLELTPGLVYYDFNAAKKALSSDEQNITLDLLRKAA